VDEPDCKIIDFAAARRRIDARGGGRGGGLGLKVDEQGRLQIVDMNSSGAVLQRWSLERGKSKELLALLTRRITAIETAEYYAAHLEHRPQPRKERKFQLCKLTREQHVGRNGCKRHRGHDGPHKDKAGEWTAAWPHVRFCGGLTRVTGGGPLPDGVTYRPIRTPEGFRGLLGDVAHILVRADGRCAHCGNRVDMELLEGGAGG
jgi:hypothetical protein